jgi:hypothetical protein
MWAKWPDLPAEEIRSALFETAIQDQFTGATPNNTCGHGKLNAEGVYKRLSESRQLQQNSRPTLERSREMDNKRQVFEFNLDPKQNKAGQLASMQVTITTDGDSVSITGISNGEKYVGELILKKKEKSDKAEGDQCWVCPKDRACAWVQPCPF